MSHDTGHLQVEHHVRHISSKLRSPKQKRLGILIKSLSGGGGSRASLAIAQGMLRKGYCVDLLLQSPISDSFHHTPQQARIFSLLPATKIEGRVASHRIVSNCRSLSPNAISVRGAYLQLPSKLNFSQLPLLASPRLVGWAVGLSSYLDRERPDAILSTSINDTAVMAMSSHIAAHRARTVAVLRIIFTSKRKLLRARMSYPFADAVVGVSRGVTKLLIEHAGVASEHAHTVYDGIELGSEVGLPVMDEFHSGVGSTIVAAGALVPDKDYETLLRAFARMLATRPARLIILGKGPSEATLKKLADDLGVAESVFFPGFVNNPGAYFSLAQLFVHTSKHEGFGLVLAEAMAHGCPVVSTDCPFGPREILDGGKYGSLVPVGDFEALAIAMKYTLDNPLAPDVLRSRASCFSIDQNVDAYERVLFA